MAILDRFQDVSLASSATAAGQNTTLTIAFTLGHGTTGSDTAGDNAETVVLEQGVAIVIHLPLGTSTSRDYGIAGFSVLQGDLPYVLRPFNPSNAYPDVVGHPANHTVVARLHKGNRYPTGAPMQLEVRGITLPRMYGMTAPYQIMLSGVQDGASKAVFAAGTLITNAHAPVFEQARYYREIVETIHNDSATNTFTSELVLRVTATDADHAFGTSVAYSILQSSPALGDEYFAIDSSTGDVSTKQALNYDTMETSVFTLVIQAIDASPPYGRANTTMVINVTGVNDHVPVFVYTGGLQYYTAVIHEHDAVGALVLALVAQDPDQGGDDTVAYSLETATGHFQVDQASGNITLAMQVQRKVLPHVVLAATAADTRVAGSVPQTKTTKVSIDVLEDNLLVEGKLSQAITANFEPRKYEEFMQAVICAGVTTCPYHVFIYNVTNQGSGQQTAVGRRQRRSDEVRVAFYVREGVADPVKPQAIKFMTPAKVLAALATPESRQLLESSSSGYESLSYTDLESRQTINVGEDGSTKTESEFDWRLIVSITAASFVCCALVLVAIVLVRRRTKEEAILLQPYGKREANSHWHPGWGASGWNASALNNQNGFRAPGLIRDGYLDPSPVRHSHHVHDAWGNTNDAWIAARPTVPSHLRGHMPPAYAHAFASAGLPQDASYIDLGNMSPLYSPGAVATPYQTTPHHNNNRYPGLAQPPPFQGSSSSLQMVQPSTEPWYTPEESATWMYQDPSSQNWGQSPQRTPQTQRPATAHLQTPAVDYVTADGGQDWGATHDALAMHMHMSDLEQAHSWQEQEPQFAANAQASPLMLSPGSVRHGGQEPQFAANAHASPLMLSPGSVRQNVEPVAADFEYFQGTDEALRVLYEEDDQFLGQRFDNPLHQAQTSPNNWHF